MIQAKDLRIGNTIQWLHEEHETFHNVDIEIISQIDKYNKDPYDDIFSRGFWFAPIDLTPEILVKCGFEWDIFYQGISNGTYILNNNHHEGFRLCKCKNRHDILIEKIEYLHELQNIHFALLKKELEYKP